MTIAVVIRKIHNSFADGALINFFSPTAHRNKIGDAVINPGSSVY
jgi:hypothetical protein